MKTKMFVAGAVGFALGAVLFAGGAAYAEGVSAERSTNTVYVDGRRVELEAYSIFGSNYVKLRDVGKAVNINVFWDGGAVQIDTASPYTGEAPAGAKPASAQTTGGAINVPQTDALFVPKEGDRILCDDGTVYEIRDMSRYDSNVFASGKLPPLPTPTCNWGLFPETALPKAEARHFSDAAGDDLLIRNLYETRRMEYTIRNALGNEPDAWNGDEPLAKIYLTIPTKYEAYTETFWPWRASELENLVHFLPNARFYIEAWDVYHNHIFQYTRYCVFSI